MVIKMQENKWTTGHVRMNWTREKVIWILKDNKYSEKYLNTLDNHKLFELGEEQGYWHGANPFKKETQKLIIDYLKK